MVASTKYMLRRFGRLVSRARFAASVLGDHAPDAVGVEKPPEGSAQKCRPDFTDETELACFVSSRLLSSPLLARHGCATAHG